MTQRYFLNYIHQSRDSRKNSHYKYDLFQNLAKLDTETDRCRNFRFLNKCGEEFSILSTPTKKHN